MNIFIIYRITKEGTMYEVSKDGVYDKITPEDMPTYISDIIHKVRQSTFIYIRNLNGLKYDIISALYLAGVNFIEGNPKESKMNNLDCKSLIGGDIAKIYHLTVINHKKKVQFIDLDNLLPDTEQVLESWGKHEKYAYVKAYERGLNDLHDICKVRRKRPITVAGATRGLIKKVMPDFKPIDINTLYINEPGDLDNFIRQTYRGGLCIYKDRDYILHEGSGICLDVHSMYPYIMITKPLPIDNPSYKEGKPTEKEFKQAENGKQAIYLHITASFEIKENCIPCVRNDDLTTHDGWLNNSYLYKVCTGEEIKTDREIDLYLTYMDYLDFLDNYKIFSIHYVDYITMDCAKPGLFMPIVRPLYHKKRQTTGGEKKMAKIIMNSISGTVAMRSTYENYAIKITDKIEFQKVKTSVSKSYIYMGSYITSWARHILIDIIKKNYDRWIYSDTDCLFLRGRDIPEGLIVGEGIGKFAIEKKFDDLVIYKQKMYGYVDSDTKNIKFTLAGVKKSDIKRIPEIMNNEKLVYEELYVKGNRGYDLRQRRDNLEKIMLNELDVDFKDGPFWKIPIRPEGMTEEEIHKYVSRETQYNDVCADLNIYKNLHMKKPSLLDLVPRANLPMTAEEFENFELYLYDYSISFDKMNVYS